MPGEILDIITSPVCVVTAQNSDKINGMTVAWIMQAAYNPAFIAVSIAPERFTHSLIKESKSFGVNILSDGQRHLGKHFGFSSGRNTDKFTDIDFHKSKSGLPIFDNVYAYIECRLINILNAGDHDLFVGEVLEKNIDDTKNPLIFKSSDYF
ncbi:MAG: flavin reductase family protein [Candidatus Omnitrophica bacterium]|nr:flavin reductase family protein [Candidatus Omnitrophota bacterium]